MTQYIEVPTKPLKIEIPEGMKVVSMDAHGYEGQSLLGRTWTKADMREWCGNKSWDWILENIISNPKYSLQMGAMERKNQIVHKGVKGSPWRIKARPMAEFLDEYWEELPW
ncbi:DUF771 domain-containing protein [Companilactobacillus allii]|uniref:DUF771 domain-containing protein n=1 Tax=Companilactobacillus allii TaxID=1847728 RepID=A0A1P8Q4I6_9LACO|nr:DUF771 domain-containing protein [Companilactobacillus allii]APX72689.1 hypothetical protein BTM29_09060 [Companilactobacillus allii]USQ69795.1 DUF771 domain-containing protein [Companilactobacillus allii]